MFRHLLRIDWLSSDDIHAILSLAQSLKDKAARGIPHQSLKGKVMAMIFEKASTRTRVSFEVGMYQLGGLALYLEASTTQLGRGESIADTAKVLSRYVDVVMIRAYSQQAVEEFAENASVPVINGLTDIFHPCQILSDLFTIRERLGDISGVRVAYVGDGNNVANSWVNASKVLGFELVLSCPKGYEPNPEVLSGAPSFIRIERDPYRAVEGAHVIYTDVWVSMGKEKEKEQRIQALRSYQVNQELLKRAPKDVLVMHCLPAHRGMEITDEVIDGPNSVVFDQAENRLHVQKAILELLLVEKGDQC